MNTKSYEEQRRDRLSESITDYLTDESVSASECYQDMLKEVESWIEYHACNMNKAKELRALLTGQRLPTPNIPQRY